MSKNMNYNYAFVMYDVNEKRVQKVFKVCKKYFNHHQNSIFRGSITPSKLIKLRADLKKVIDETEDYVTIIKLLSKNSFDEEELGVTNNSESMFI
ncbi:CRISPR-associated endonuclease Cas2 [Clostridium botulinum]|uniref:CRISPR-associated endonuclease Cas2 n=1 Tax=Clostridium TaxID=1485 RepID=UPI0007176699|nr:MULTISPECIES: CRISPR-associated endonuclease Cas2 [Clostridium]KRU23803.1 CRISPR-associated endoribonuclease Cas2 [Clostridium sporogenes]KRU26496.1 CRISPR-associated endoribonuclease Cas2 [Clostridium sporogenes]KRU28545.1 CRISPR-associated endoribonuclease Cas2 [Clostridium sporogenes]KRU44087.1 CRISPR-associated endoribonuclease Cas2 [Clostridium sporogenes]MBZ1331052.1 CRISPR-associated endonuclease Cas2 [Clostridium botulinum]